MIESLQICVVDIHYNRPWMNFNWFGPLRIIWFTKMGPKLELDP